MRNTIYLFLVCALHLSHALNEATTEALDRAHLVHDDLFPLSDYEVLDAFEEGDEDVVRIRKRANNDCETDCLNYSGWEVDEQMHCDEEDADDENTAIDASLDEKRSVTNDTEHTITLVKRGKKEPML
jgi:hypothetical protein